MTCPHCAERPGVLAALRGRCGKCGLSLRAAPSGASAELRRVLVERRLRLRWLVVGAIATALVSLIPSLGVLQLLVLAPIQLFCIEKGVADFTSHLPARALFGFEMASGLLYIVLAGLGVGLGFIAESLSVFFAVPSFILAFVGTRVLSLRLARRTLEGRGPGLLVGALMALVGAMVVVPPLLLLVVTGHFSAQLEARVWDPRLVLQLASMGSLSALDLFLMPAWLTSVLAVFGMADIAPAFGWAGSWWFAIVATVAVFGEAVVDNAFDRRRRFARKVWPAIQSVLTPPTLFFMVCVLGRDLDWGGRLLALAAGLAGGWQLRRGVNRAKTAIGFFPGASLARRRAQLITIPLRLAGALVVVLLARNHPYVVAVVVALGVFVTMGFLAVSWLGRRALRAEARLPCAGCGSSVKRRAAVCWKCHLPVAVTLVRAHPVEVRGLMASAAAFAGATSDELKRVELAEAAVPDADALRLSARDLNGAAARDVLAVASAATGGSAARLGELARVLSRRRSTARALLEEL